MRYCILLLIFASLIHATYRDNFCTATSKYVVFWNAASIGSIGDCIMNDIADLKSLEQIKSSSMGYFIQGTPFASMFSLLSIKSKFDSCLSKTPAKTEAMGLLGRLAPCLGNRLRPVYQLIYDQMKGSTAAKAAKVNTCYYYGWLSVTPHLIQNLIWAAQRNVTKEEWACCVTNLPAILSLAGSNLTYRYPRRTSLPMGIDCW